MDLLIAAAARTPALESDVRDKAADALGEIHDQSAVPALIEAIYDPEQRVRVSALHSLGSIGHKSAVCV